MAKQNETKKTKALTTRKNPFKQIPILPNKLEAIHVLHLSKRIKINV